MTDARTGWGLLSTARINKRLIPCIRSSPRSRLAAVASRDKERAESYADAWQIPTAHASYEALLADPEVDIVYISLPNSLHAEWSIKCADAGKHVLCEKPLAVTPEEVERMKEAAYRNRVVVQEACMMRFHRQTDDARRLVADGAIGEPRLIRSLFTFTLQRAGDIRLDPQLGGGALWDLGSYQVSLAQALLHSDPVEVMGWQLSTTAGVDLSFMAQLRYERGTLVQFFCSFQSAAAWDADLLGSTGTLHLDQPYLNQPGQDSHIRVLREDARESSSTFGDSKDQLAEETLTYQNNDAYQDEVDGMVACVLDGASPSLSLDQSRGNIAAVGALLKSARRGTPVSLKR